MHDTAHPSDSDLLAEYLRVGDERAFAALVAQHQRMVIGTAWRRTGDAEAARDIAQEVFATLARKAAWLIDRRSIAGWLHITTVHLAARLHRSEASRRLREDRFFAQASEHPHAAPWHLLEEALAEVPGAEREAVVLHFLEDRSYEEMAQLLGLSEAAARKRVSRGIQHLGARLHRRGITAGAASLLAGAVSTQGALPVSISVSASLTLAATSSSSTIWISLVTAMSHFSTKTALAVALVIAAPIAWQSHANSEQRAALAQLQAQNAQATAEGESRVDGTIALRSEIELATRRLQDAEAARAQAERALTAARNEVDQLRNEVVVSFGTTEEVARELVRRIGPLIEFESIKDELKKNPTNPRLRELAEKGAQGMADLFALSAQVAVLEEDPIQYARFNAVLYAEALQLDAGTRDRLEAVFSKSLAKLREDGLTIRNRPKDDANGDWIRRRNAAEEQIWKQIEPILPPAAKSHPLLSFGHDGSSPPVLFTSPKALGDVFPTLSHGQGHNLRAVPTTPAPASTKQP